jgi:hypothetical protein
VTVIAKPNATEDALARFDVARAQVAALELYADRLEAGASGFASGCENCRAARDPFYRQFSDSYAILERGAAKHLSAVRQTTTRFREAERRLDAALAGVRGFGFWPLLAVLAVVLAGKAAMGVSDEVRQHYADQAALRNQLRDLKDRCARGKATPDACAMIPKLEASIYSSPLDRALTTSQKVLWAIGGVIALSFVFRLFKK